MERPTFTLQEILDLRIDAWRYMGEEHEYPMLLIEFDKGKLKRAAMWKNDFAIDHEFSDLSELPADDWVHGQYCLCERCYKAHPPKKLSDLSPEEIMDYAGDIFYDMEKDRALEFDDDAERFAEHEVHLQGEDKDGVHT